MFGGLQAQNGDTENMNGKKWTEEDETTFSRLYSNHNNKELATLLGRTEKAIRVKASSRYLNVRKDNLATGNPPSLTEVEKAYVACALDCEGTLSITRGPRKHKGSYLINTFQIINTSKPFLEKLCAILQIPLTAIHQDKRQKPNHKDCYRFNIANRGQINWVLQQILPYLVIKREQAILMLRFCEQRRFGREKYSLSDENLRRQISSLNRKGRRIE